MKLVLHRLCLSSLYFFYISYVCIFLPTEERVNKHGEKAKCVHECEGSREKRFCPIFILFLFFFVGFLFCTVQGQLYDPPSNESPSRHRQGGCWGNNDCVIKMADRYCYQSFFKNFSYILLLLSNCIANVIHIIINPRHYCIAVCCT